MADPVAKERPGKTKPAKRAPVTRKTLTRWVSEQVALLRAGRLDEIDAENVAEELSDVGGEQYNRLESALEVLLMHMLKWDHQPGRRSRSWSLTIEEHRLRVAMQLRKNPGLKSRLAEAVEDGFRLGRVRAAREMNDRRENAPGVLPL